MNIYVASFRQAPEIAKYIIDVNEEAHGLFYWQEWYISEGVTEIKAGDVIKVINTNPNLPYETRKMYPAYIIARMDHIVTDPGEPNDNEALMIPLEFENDDEYATNRWVNVIGRNGYPNYDSNVWETCTPNNGYANEVPWSFITEGVITDYISFQWNDKYYEPGSFSLALPANDENMGVFQEGRYILNEESEHVMMIETVQFNNNLKSDGYIMTVSGRSIEAILERRIAFPGQGLNTNEYKGEDGMRKAIYDLITNFFITPENIAMEAADGTKSFYYPERRVPFIELPNDTDSYIKRPFRASVNQTVAKDDLLKVISELCKNSNLGFKILATPRFGNSRCITWKFVLYTGEDKSYNRVDKTKPLLLFSPTVGNVEAIATTKDTTNYRNAIFCGVEKESDGYINLTTNATEANYFAQKTGVELIDSFNSNATKLITGVKETLVTKLEPSPLCYTGILFLAIAAARTDRDYTATVTKIERVGGYTTKFVTSITPGGRDPVIPDNVGYMIAYKTASDASNGVNEFALPVITQYISTKRSSEYPSRPAISYNNMLMVKSLTNSEIDRVFFNWHGTVYDVDVEYFYSQNESYGILRPKDHIDERIETIPIFENSSFSSQISELSVEIKKESPSTSEPGLIISYPSDYVSKSDADNIIITFREAFGDDGATGSSKTRQFRLSSVNQSCLSQVDKDNNKTDFKNSTAYGWLTTPILKQALSDLNNTTFSRLSSLKKSAIQIWFKTFDKYTSSQTQMRWLCQEYISDAKSVGIDRREVFVEEDNSDSDDWNASKINQFQSSTVTISVDDEEDEESDEVVNERLLESARKRSGDYRKKRDIDASLELENYKYRSDAANGYDLGDIIQVDDGWGNLDQFIITGYVISVDTTSGPKRVPTFERYEPLPKAYRQLDWLQVANMILPAKFNKRYAGAASAVELNLPSRVYFGSINSTEDSQLGGLCNIWSESQNKLTEIEADLQYIKKTNINQEEDQDLSNNFALISAIGSENRDSSYNYGGINIPFAIISTKYKSPYYFMTMKTASDDPEYLDNNRWIYQQMGTGRIVDTFASDPTYIYYSGVGYKNLYIDESEHSIAGNLLDKYLYRAMDDGNKQKININKLSLENPQYTNYTGELYNISDRSMYFSNSSFGDTVISRRPLSPHWYGGNREINNLNAYWFLDSGTKLGLNNEYISNNYNNKLYRCLSQSLYPSDRDTIEVDDRYWGQDNYRYLKYYFRQDDDYDDLQYENNIVIGGLGYYSYVYIYNSELQPIPGDYKLFFDNKDAQHNDDERPGGYVYRSWINSVSPRSCDSYHGVRVFEIKIYETEAATRYTQFVNNDHIHKIHNDTPNDGSNITYGDTNYNMAFYPDLTTRKLVHDYVPVVYLEGGDDILDTEKYGLFDLVDQVFVPINWGDNENATFIEAGGEIARE